MTSRDESIPDRGELTPLARDSLGGPQDAEDLAHDVWLLLRRQPPGRVQSMRSWLRVAVLHLAVRKRVRDRRRAERERIVARSDREPSVLELLEQRSQRDFLAARVNELAAPYREVVRLRYLEEREIDEITALLGRSPATVRSQLKRGLDQLRVRLGSEPRRRRELLVLLPWLRRRRGRRTFARLGPRHALVAGLAVAGLGLGILLVDRGPSRAPLVAATPPRDVAAPSLAEAPAESVRSWIPVTARPEPRTEVPVADAWSVDLEGTVRDPDGQPVAGVAVVVGNQDGSATRIAARSDASGRYRAERVDGRLLVWAEHEEWIPTHRHLIATKPPASELELRLGYPIGTLVGQVSTAQGLPVSGAEVTLLGSVERFVPSDQSTLALATQTARAVTEADGRFRLGLPLQRSFRLVVRAEGHPWKVEGFSRESELPQAVEISLPPPCSLEGRVVRPDGRPASGVRLGLDSPGASSAESSRRETLADEGGRFRFEGQPKGPFVLRLLEDPTGASSSCFVEGELSAREHAWREVVLGEEHTLRGRALDGDRPLAGWGVELEASAQVGLDELRSSRTGPDGSFAFPSCSLAGAYALRLFEPGDTGGVPAQAVEVRAGTGEVFLRPGDETWLPGSLAGRFEKATLGSMPVVAVLRREHCSPVLLHVDTETGEFRAPRLLPGGHRLLAWIPNKGVWEAATLDVLPGQRAELVVPAPTLGGLEVLAEVADPSTWVDWSVAVTTPAFHDDCESSVQRIAKVVGKKAFYSGLLPGEHDCRIKYDGVELELRRVRVEPGATTTLEVSLPEPIVVKLQLVLERTLRPGETVSLVVRAAGRERILALQPRRIGRSETFRILLTRGVEEILVRTSLGLGGKLVPQAADLVPDAKLKLKLVDAAGD